LGIAIVDPIHIDLAQISNLSTEKETNSLTYTRQNSETFRRMGKGGFIERLFQLKSATRLMSNSVITTKNGMIQKLE